MRQGGAPNVDARQLVEKLDDALVPGAEIELDPDEAELAGAFVEDALGEDDARESAIDLVE